MHKPAHYDLFLQQCCHVDIFRRSLLTESSQGSLLQICHHFVYTVDNCLLTEISAHFLMKVVYNIVKCSIRIPLSCILKYLFVIFIQCI